MRFAAWPLLALAAAQSLPIPHVQNVPAEATYPQPSADPGTPSRPLSVASTTYTSPMAFLASDGKPLNVYPDLGFSGVVAGDVVWTFGDTTVQLPSGQILLNAVDSTATGNLSYPMLVEMEDMNLHYRTVNSLVPLTSDELASGGYTHWGFGGTNIVEVSPGVGLIYYLKLYRSANSNDYTVHGAGVARLTFDANHKPTATRLGDTVWSANEPSWGDVGLTLDSQSDPPYLYVFGHGPAINNLDYHVFVARVPPSQAGDVSAYEYYLNSTDTWTSRRLSASGAYGTIALNPDFAVANYLQVGQAPPFWSNYFRQWMWIYGNQYGDSDVYVRLAPRLEGPWTDYGRVAPTDSSGQSGQLKYAINGHPAFDNSGKTVLCTWSEAGQIRGVVVEWK